MTVRGALLLGKKDAPIRWMKEAELRHGVPKGLLRPVERT